MAADNLLKEGKDPASIFITAHRRENLGELMHHMFRTIRRVLDEHPECKAIYPIHMNPVVRKAADEETIYRNFKEVMENQEAYDAMSQACNHFEITIVLHNNLTADITLI